MKFALRLTATIVLLTALFWQIGPQSIFENYASMRWGILAWIVPVLVAQFLVFTWRWKVILDDLTVEAVPFGLFVRALGASFLYGQFLPAGVGADVVRTADVARFTTLKTAGFSVFVDRVSGLVVLMLMIVALTPLVLIRIDSSATNIGFAIFAAAAVLGMFAVFLTVRPARLMGVLAKIPLLSELQRALVDPALATKVVGSGVVIHLFAVLLIYVISQAIGVEVRLSDCLLFVPFALFLTALPISIAGWGVREGSLAACFALIGVPAAETVSVSVLFGLTGPLIGLVYALTMPFLPGRGRRIKSGTDVDASVTRRSD